MIIKESDLKKSIGLHTHQLYLISQIESMLDHLLTFTEEDRGFGSKCPDECLKMLRNLKGSIGICLDREEKEYSMKKDQIKLYLHCRDCMTTKPKNQSAEEYARLNIGRTDHGIQVWCTRHNKEVAHLSYDWSEIDKIKNPQCERC